MNNYKCTKVGNTIRCECGGKVSVGATLHPIQDLAIGGNTVYVKHNMRKIAGYQGMCMKCRKEGRFYLPGFEHPSMTH